MIDFNGLKNCLHDTHLLECQEHFELSILFCSLVLFLRVVKFEYNIFRYIFGINNLYNNKLIVTLIIFTKRNCYYYKNKQFLYVT